MRTADLFDGAPEFVNSAKVEQPQQDLFQGHAFQQAVVETDEAFQEMLNGLSVRARHVLQGMNITTLARLSSLTSTELLWQRNCGRKTLNEILVVVRAHQRAFDVEPAWESCSSPTPAPSETWSIGLSSLPFSTCARNLFRHRELTFVGELAQLSKGELRQVPNVGRTTVEEIVSVLHKLEVTLSSEVGPWTPEQAAQAPTRTKPEEPDPPTLVAALRHRASQAASSERNAAWTISRLGWGGAPARTLEQVGTSEGVTRERVRQVVGKSLDRLGVFRPPDALVAAADLIAGHAPVSQAEADVLLADAGVEPNGFDLGSLLDTLERLNVPTGFVVRQIGEQGWALLKDHPLVADLGECFRSLRGLVRAQGCITIRMLLNRGFTKATRAGWPP